MTIKQNVIMKNAHNLKCANSKDNIKRKFKNESFRIFFTKKDKNHSFAFKGKLKSKKKRENNPKYKRKTKIVNYEKLSKINEKNVKNDKKSNKNTKITQKDDKKGQFKKKLELILSGTIIGFLNGFFGGGGGMICVPILQKVLNLDSKKAHATAIAIIFPLSLISAFIYVYNGVIQSLPLLATTIGVVSGGLLGAFALKVLPPKAIKIIFALIMFVGGIKLII